MQEKQTKKGPEAIALKEAICMIIAISFVFAMIYLWYIAIPVLFIWLVWKKTKLTEKNKSIISIIILLFFIVFKISSDYNHRAPTITITEPENNISVQSKSITIRGIVDPKNSQLQIEGKEVSIKDGGFEYEAKLIEENSSIILIADNLGKKTESSLIVNRILSDDERAIVNLENIKNNDIIKLPQFEIKGSTLLESVTVKINDQDVEIKDNQFSYIIDLKEGKNNVNIIATNTKSSIIKKETLVINRELTEKEIAVIEKEQKAKIEKERMAREEAIKKADDEAAENSELKSLGKWYGQRDVSLGKKGLQYVAIFDPPLPKESFFIPPAHHSVKDPIYPYLVGLLHEVWGLLPSQLSSPQFASSLVFYEDASGEKFSFLLFKDETTNEIFGVSFWKE